MAEKTVQVAFRFPTDPVDRLNDYAEVLRKEQLGFQGSRADAVRRLLIQALAEVKLKRTSRKK